MRLFACLIVAPQRGYDEPAILSYAISSLCPTSADGIQFSDALFIRKSLSKLDKEIATSGYARLQTRDQDLAGQIAELQAAGCGNIFKEKGARTKHLVRIEIFSITWIVLLTSTASFSLFL